MGAVDRRLSHTEIEEVVEKKQDSMQFAQRGVPRSQFSRTCVRRPARFAIAAVFVAMLQRCAYASELIRG